MQPRSRPFFVRVTNAAPGAASVPCAPSTGGIFPAPRYPSSAARAIPSRLFRCDPFRYVPGSVPAPSVMSSPPPGSTGLRAVLEGNRLLESLRQAYVAGHDDLRLAGEECGNDVGVELGPGAAPDLGDRIGNGERPPVRAGGR